MSTQVEDQWQGMDAVWTYLTAAAAFFLANINTFTAVLGFFLVVVRLCYEIPKAYRAVASIFGKKKNE